MNLEPGSISSTRLNRARGSGRQTVQQNDFANIIMCKKEFASPSTFYDTGKSKRQEEKKKLENTSTFLYIFFQRKIRSVLPPRADWLPGRKRPLEERALCGTRSRTYWLSAAQHQYRGQGESLAFPVALSCAQGCSAYLFSNAARAAAQTNPEAGGSK